MTILQHHFQKKLGQDGGEGYPSPEQKIKGVFANVAPNFFDHAIDQLQTLLRGEIIFHLNAFNPAAGKAAGLNKR